jgi:hypothetical protein
MTMETTSTRLRLSVELMQRLEAKAAEDGSTTADLIRSAVEAYLDGSHAESDLPTPHAVVVKCGSGQSFTYHNYAGVEAQQLAKLDPNKRAPADRPGAAMKIVHGPAVA